MKSVITNVAPTARFYGFIPPHGRLLEVDEAVTLDGDLRTVLAGGRGRYGRKTELKALDAAIAGVDITYAITHSAAEASSSSLTE